MGGKFISLQKKIILSYLGIIMIFVGVNLFGLYEIKEITNSYDEMINNDYEYLNRFKQFQSELIEEIALSYRFLLTQNPDILDKLEELNNENGNTLNQLMKISDGAIKEEDLVSLKILFDEYTKIERESISFVQNGNIEKANSLMKMSSVEKIETNIIEISNNINTYIKDEQIANTVKIKKIFTIVLLTMLIVSFLSVLLSLILAKRISSPIKIVANYASFLANGDLTNSLPDLIHNDEIGYLIRVFRDLHLKLKEMILKIQLISDKIDRTSTDLAFSSQINTKSMEQVSVAMQNIASDSNEQIRHIEDTKTSVGILEIGMKRIYDNAQLASNSTEQTFKLSNLGLKILDQTLAKMNEIGDSVSKSVESVMVLSERSKKINDIVNLISHISGQTNLLALNATIESARAGEHGKGFSIVAEQIRKLAEQSGQATNDISEMVRMISNDTQIVVDSMVSGNAIVRDGIDSVKYVGGQFTEIYSTIEHITMTNQNTLKAIEEMEKSLYNVVNASDTMKRNFDNMFLHIQNVSAASEEQYSLLDELNIVMSQLVDLTSELNELTKHFKTN